MRRRLQSRWEKISSTFSSPPRPRTAVHAYNIPYVRVWRGPGVVRWGEGGGGGGKDMEKNTTGVTKNLRSIGFQSSFIIIGGFFLPISFFPLYVDNNTVYILIGRTIVL